MVRILLLPLQFLVSAFYYVNAPFILTPLILFLWVLNAACVIYLLIHANQLVGEMSADFKRARLAFTATLILLELTINMNSDSYAADRFHGLASDIEVLVTGITLGVLWYKELTTPLTHQKS
jgi:hypothetical protein